MEINGQQNTVQQTTPASSVSTPPPINEQETQAQETELSTESTVNLSTKAQRLSEEDTSNETTTTISTQEEAEESVAQFQQDAANDPSLTQSAQSSSLTSDQVSQLIG